MVLFVSKKYGEINAENNRAGVIINSDHFFNIKKSIKKIQEYRKNSIVDLMSAYTQVFNASGKKIKTVKIIFLIT